jgi:hypothetical protein
MQQREATVGGGNNQSALHNFFRSNLFFFMRTQLTAFYQIIVCYLN